MIDRVSAGGRHSVQNLDFSSDNGMKPLHYTACAVHPGRRASAEAGFGDASAANGGRGTAKTVRRVAQRHARKTVVGLLSLLAKLALLGLFDLVVHVIHCTIRNIC